MSVLIPHASVSKKSCPVSLLSRQFRLPHVRFPKNTSGFLPTRQFYIKQAVFLTIHTLLIKTKSTVPKNNTNKITHLVLPIINTNTSPFFLVERSLMPNKNLYFSIGKQFQFVQFLSNFLFPFQLFLLIFRMFCFVIVFCLKIFPLLLIIVKQFF